MPQRLRFQALAFLGSFLAFCLELAAAKLLLPKFGGSAYVWTGAMMFFQALLLLGYLYARRAPFHPRAHATLLVVPFFFLPLALPPAIPGSDPFLELMRALIHSVGAPFFILSTTVVVAQSWLMRSSLPERKDGYFLYAASNAGAACGLLAYPFLIEPLLPPSAEAWLWRGLYAAYAALSLACASGARAPLEKRAAPGSAPSARDRALWLLLSAAPCAALLAATNLLSMDFAAVPLLWTAPLAAYLLTFVLNFKRTPWYPESLNRKALPAFLGWLALVLIALLFAFRSGAPQRLTRVLDLGNIAYIIVALFALSMIFHKSLAAGRPSSERAMAEYYSWIAGGGLFGSLLIGLVVPLLGRSISAVALDWAAVSALAVAAIVTRDWESITAHRKTAAAVAALGLAAAAGIAAASSRAGTVYGLRNFYGIYSVQDREGVRWLFHGNTDHGMQFLERARQDEPLSYYGFSSPLGDAWSALGGRWRSIAVVGLGAGSIAAYGRAGMEMDFYELDPDVAAIARRWFTHLDLSAAKIRVVTGDARISLDRSEGAPYDAIILDAFSSGAVPVHLLTKEAFAVYLRRLKPGGLILLHVSSRYLDLRPVLAATTRELGLFGAAKSQSFDGRVDQGRTASSWAAISPREGVIEALVSRKGWSAFDLAPGYAAWTDRHASLLPAIAF